ncbi:MAG: alpha/beta fold hydrolase [Alphaproteobacteria bacterium]
MSRRILVFVPGILGTEIKDRDGVVWPPQMGDVLRQDKLLDRITSAKGHGNPIRSAYCRDVYEPIWRTLSAIDATDDDLLFLPMGFDWRLDIIDAAHRLAEDIGRAVRGSDKRNLQIVIVAHSMGGLVVRTILEQNLRPSWVKYVRAAIFVGTPHSGAPRAAAAALGLVAVQGIRAATLRRYVESGRFQSFLGLMPPGDCPIIQNWDGRRFDSSDTSVAICRELGIDPKKALKHWNLLRSQGFSKPDDCHYFCIGNGNVQTIAALSRQSAGWRILERLRATRWR